MSSGNASGCVNVTLSICEVFFSLQSGAEFVTGLIGRGFSSSWIPAGVLVVLFSGTTRADELSSKAALASRIDSILADHWQKSGIAPAKISDDATFFRRAMLDLNGRIPTPAEWLAFEADSEPNKRRRLIARLMDGPEFQRHLAHRLDQIIQGRYAGSSEFIGWLENQIVAGKAWDKMFEEMLERELMVLSTKELNTGIYIKMKEFGKLQIK